jgi:hypothetical protein
VFQDAVDINTNPKIGSMWMAKGHQAKVETPGNNEKGVTTAYSRQTIGADEIPPTT